MKVVALISGGKDSCFNMMHCVANGNEITALANLHPAPTDSDEMDSWMFQTVGHDIVHLYSEAMGLPLYRQTINGSNKETTLHYNKANGDETEDLFNLIAMVQERQPDIQAISVGAIASNYQRLRVENVASRLGLVVLSYLWERDQTELLHEMITAGVNAVMIKVACIGLNKRHLGKTLAQMEDHLAMLHERYEVHPCGEGGEYETIVLDCPLFINALHITHQDCVQLEGDTAYVRLKAELRDKIPSNRSWVTPLLMSTKLESKYEAFLAQIEPSLQVESPAEPSLTGLSLVQPTLNAARTDGPLTSRQFLIKDLSELTLHFKNIDSSKVVFCFLVLRDMSDFPKVNSVYAKLWKGFHPPSRVCIATSIPEGVKCLLYTVEMTKFEVCCMPDRRLWVQSRSSWAPSNIGPYSQITISNGIAFVSGQIGLQPSSMELVKTFNEELVWSLQSLERILRSQKIEVWQGILVVYMLRASSTRTQCIGTVCQEFLTSANSELLIVELPAGSQLPRNSNVELQLIAADNIHFKVVTDARVTNNQVLLSFSSSSTSGLASIPSQKLLFKEAQVTNFTIGFKSLQHSD